MPLLNISKVSTVPSSNPSNPNQSAKGGNQGQSNNNDNKGNNKSSGNNSQDSGNKSDPSQKPRHVKPPQQTAAVRLCDALGGLILEAEQFQANLLIVTAARVYQSVLHSFIKVGFLWHPASSHFQEATSDFVNAWEHMRTNGQWEVAGLSPNTGVEPTNSFIPIVDEMNAAYLALEVAMGVDSTVAGAGGI